MRRVAALALLVMSGAPALAHVGAPPAPHDLWSSWNLDPLLLLSLLAASWMYGRGFARGQGRTTAIVGRWRATCFVWAMTALFVALVSPLDALGSSLLTAHMVQHLLLLVVVPALLVVSAPGYVMAWALPLAARRRLARGWNRSGAHGAWRTVSRALFTPLGALGVFTGVVWAWHAPGLYQAALANEGVHRLEHASFMAAAYPFWSVLLAPLGRHRTNRGAAVAMLFGASAQGSALGALMAFSPTPWYPAYAATTAAWGLTPLQDQQLAGVVMWMPIGTIYVLLACLLLWLWLRDADARPPTRSTPLATLRGSPIGGE